MSETQGLFTSHGGCVVGPANVTNAAPTDHSSMITRGVRYQRLEPKQPTLGHPGRVRLSLAPRLQPGVERAPGRNDALPISYERIIREALLRAQLRIGATGAKRRRAGTKILTNIVEFAGAYLPAPLLLC